MAKNTDSSIKLLVLYDILLKTTDEEHALSTNEIIEELKKRGISVSRKVLPSDIDLLNKYGYEICSYVKKSRYYYAVHQFFDTAEITMLTDVIKASKLTETRKETIINKLYSTIGIYKNADNTDNIIFLDSKKHGNQRLFNRTTTWKNLETIGILSGEIPEAFYNNYNNENVTNKFKKLILGKDVTKVSLKIFNIRAASVYYMGTEAEWNSITFENNLELEKYATRYFYSATDPFTGSGAVTSGNYWHYGTTMTETLIW